MIKDTAEITNATMLHKKIHKIEDCHFFVEISSTMEYNTILIYLEIIIILIIISEMIFSLSELETIDYYRLKLPLQQGKDIINSYESNYEDFISKLRILNNKNVIWIPTKILHDKSIVYHS